MKFVFIILSTFFLSFFATKASCQISDSLYKILPDSLRPKNKAALTTDEKVKIIYRVGVREIHLCHKELLDIVIAMDHEITTTNNQRIKVLYSSAIASFYVGTAELGLAFTCYQKVIEYAHGNAAFNYQIAEANIFLGGLYSVKFNEDSAIYFLHNGITQIGNYPDTSLLQNAYNSYLLMYTNLHLFSEALVYADKYLYLFSAKDKWNDYYTTIAIGKAYLYKCKYVGTHEKKYADSAKILIDSIMSIKKNTSDLWYATCYYLLGSIKEFEQQHKEAISCFDSSLQPLYVHGNVINRVPTLAKLHKGICLLKLNDPQGLYIDTLNISEKDFESLQYKNRALYEYTRAHGNWKAATAYHEKYMQYTDSLATLSQRGKVFEVEQKYAVAEKEATINNLEKEKLLKEKEDNKNKTIAIIVGLLLIIAILLLVWYYKQLQLTKEKEKQQLVENLTKAEMEMDNERASQQIRQQTLIKEQREKISKSIHDEINSGLAALRFYITDLKASATETKTKEVLGKVEEEAENLYLQAREFMNNLTAANKTTANYNVISLLDNLAARFNDESILHIINKIDRLGIEKHFTPRQHYEMYSIIKESIANIIKHAGASTAIISISFTGGRCNFSITDNGKGFNRQQVKEGLGLKSLESRVTNELQGELKITSSGKGTVVTGSFAA